MGQFSKTLEEFFWTLNVPYILFPWLTGFIQTEFEFNGDTTVQHTLAVKPSGSGSPLLNSVASEVRCICCGVSFKIITKIESVIWLQIRLDWSSVKNWVCERLELTTRTRPRHWASLCSRLRILWFKLHMLWPGWQKPVKFCDIVNLNWARSFLFPPTEHLTAQFLPNWEKMQLWRFVIQLDLISVHVVTSCLTHTKKNTHTHWCICLKSSGKNSHWRWGMWIHWERTENCHQQWFTVSKHWRLKKKKNQTLNNSKPGLSFHQRFFFYAAQINICVHLGNDSENCLDLQQRTFTNPDSRIGKSGNTSNNSEIHTDTGGSI